MGIRALRKLLIGRESVAGTAVAATTYWRGTGALEDARTVNFVPETVGLLVPTDRQYTSMYQGRVTLDSAPATFEQLPYVFEAGIKSIGSGATDTAGSAIIYNYTLPTTAANSIATYTIEGGDDTASEEMEYSFVTDFVLSGRSGEAWMVESNWVGRNVATCDFTGSLTIPTVEEILFNKSTLSIEAASAAYGTTAKANTLLEASLSVTTGWQPVYTANGQLYFDFIKCIGPEIYLDLTFEHNASAAAELAAWKAGTKRSIQIKTVGSAMGTGGGTYTVKTLIINLSGRYEKIEKLDEINGNDVMRARFKAGYDLTESRIGNFIVVNEVATLA